MPNKIKKGSTVMVVEGPDQGEKGTVTEIRRHFDADSKTMRRTVWINTGDSLVRTRLAWVREI